MASTIGPNEIALLQTLVTAGDRIGYYTQLAAWGDDYGRLALGVINNDTLSGATANIYFVQHAGPNGSPSAVPFDTLASISLALMRADFLARRDAFNAGQNALDLPVDKIHTYHTLVFADYDVEPIAWTPHFALEQLATVAEREALWDELLWAGGPLGNANAYIQSLVSAASMSSDFAAYSFELSTAGALATTALSTDYGPYSVSLGANLGSVIGGNSSSNILTGTIFGDVIMGFDGADKIVGGEGNDRLYGGDGADILSAGFGSDRIDGGTGDDILNAGRDQAPGTFVYTGFFTLPSSFQGGLLSESPSWRPADRVADYLAGGVGNDTYWVGANAGIVLNLGSGGVLQGIQEDRRASILDTTASGSYMLNDRVFENIDVVFDSDGQGVINWGLCGAITPVFGTSYSYEENCSGTFSTGTIMNLIRTERFSDLLSAISGEQMNVYIVPRTTGQLGEYPLLATVTKVTNAEGVTFDRLLFFTDPTRDGIDYRYNTATNAIQFLGHLYGVFAIDGYYTGIPITGSGAIANALMAIGTTGSFGINITGYVGRYTGNEANNNITSTIGADNISGGGGDDTIVALGGNDILIGGAGADKLDGGAGTDIADYSTFAGGAGIYADLLNGFVQDNGGAYDRIIGIETIYGTDALRAGALSDVMLGNNESNSFFGFGGQDYIVGAGGNDYIDVGAGMTNIAIGGTGNDTLVGGVDDDFLYGNAGNDTLVGGAGADWLFGGDFSGGPITGSDTLSGGAGNDVLAVGSQGGNFALADGGAGNDIIYGGALANDIIRGGTGSDYMYGNTGADTYRFEAGDLISGDQDSIFMNTAGDSLSFALSYQNQISIAAGVNAGVSGVYLAHTASTWFAWLPYQTVASVSAEIVFA